MKCSKKYIKIFLLISMVVVFISGCTSSNPIVPDINPNPSVNPANSIVSYIEVTASSSTIKINQSLQFVVKGYNSDNEWVIIDKSKIKLWKWSVQGQCYNCVVDFVNLSPKSGSLTTTFSSGKTGIYFIVAYYQENIGDAYITDYTEVKVV